MRIAVSGASNMGKSTFVRDFIQYWPKYTQPVKSCRDIIGDKHSKNTTPEIQWKLLNHYIDEYQKTSKTDNVIYDRCTLDILAYSLWAHEKGLEGFTREWMNKLIPVVRESFSFIDIIFFTPMTKFNTIKIEDDGVREIDENYIEEIDHIFKSLYRHWNEKPDSPFFSKDDRPAIIEIFGTQQERIEIAKLYIGGDGESIEPDKNIFSPEEMRKLEAIKQSFDSHK